jgi:hypothetical protein
MNKKILKLYDVITDTKLPDLSVSELPSEGDPIEINGEMYFVCERNYAEPDNPEIGVIPLIVKNPSSVVNINQYVKCLSTAQRRIRFRNKNGSSSLENSEEMIIS